MKITILARAFFEWHFSDENSDGITITDKALEHNFGQLLPIFMSCRVIPARLTSHPKDGDYHVDNVTLILNERGKYTYDINGYKVIVRFSNDTDLEVDTFDSVNVIIEQLKAEGYKDVDIMIQHSILIEGGVTSL